MNKLDLEAFGDLVTDDVSVTLPYAPPPVQRFTGGKEAVVALYSGFPSLVTPLGFPDLRISPLVEEGEFVVEYRSDCAYVATGKPYRNTYISKFTVRDGKIAAFTEFYNPLVFLEAAEA